EGARSGPGAAADHCRYAGHQGFFDLLRADEVDMRIDTAGGNNRALSGDNLGASADSDGDARLDIAVTCLADGGNFSSLDADICLDDAPVIDNQRIGDNGIGDLRREQLPLSHAIANDFAAAEFNLFAVDGEILLHLYPQFGIGQAHLIADGGAEHFGIGLARDLFAHCNGPITRPANPYTTRFPANATSCTVRVSPGSKRPAVPAAISSLKP